MTTHLLLLKTVSNTGGSLFTIPRTLLPGVVAVFSSGQWSLLYLCSFTDNPGGGCVPRSNTAGAGEGCGVVADSGCHLTACSTTFICSPPRAALSRGRAKNAHKKRRDGGAWRHYSSYNSYNTQHMLVGQKLSRKVSQTQCSTTTNYSPDCCCCWSTTTQNTIDNQPSYLLNPDDGQYNCNCRL